jgi:BolA family transcriptional regulator, general stress-responsive regulator
MSERAVLIESRLRQAFAPSELEVLDESHKHVGHAGARDGRGHFAVRLRSAAFDGQGLLARHRAVYQALGALMQSDIHALSIQALAPDEA